MKNKFHWVELPFNIPDAMKFISFFLSVFASCCLVSTALAGGDMAPDLKSGSFWSSSREDLFGKYFNGEAGGWVDKEKTQLRMARPRIKIGEISLGETLVNWKDDTPNP